MKTAVKKLRSPLKWHGGKSYLARRIIALFPEHRLYVEPFAGGLSVLLNKPPAEREVAGDIDANLINFWSFLRDWPTMLGRQLDETLYSEAVFEGARAMLGDPDPLRNAWSFLVRNRFSRGGLGKDFAWSERLRGKRRPSGPVPGEINAWDTIRREISAIAERIERVEFRCWNATDLIHSVRDTRDSLVYADPPYLPDTRTHRTAYAHEMSWDDHKVLLDELMDCRGKVFLSGYRSALYDEALDGWTRHEFDMPNHSGQGKSKQRRLECVWEKP